LITVTLYIAGNSPACDQVKAQLQEFQADFPHQLVLIDIDSDPAMKSAYAGRVPVVQVGPYRLEGEISPERLKVALGAAIDRGKQLEKIDSQSYEARLGRGRTVTDGDRLSLWISKNYIHVFNILIALYVGVPFLAPVFMKNGAVVPANLIYRFYSIMCHQLPYRSWFLYGEQAYYPRQLAGISGVLSYEQVMNISEINVFNDRQFTGNEVVGYKVALCERDIAMYGAMLIFGIGFALSGRRIRSVPWYLWVLIGLVPIGIDGFSQLPSVIPGLPSWLPIRESTPLLRTITGTLFGVMTTWYLYPMIEETMKETRRLVARKKATAEQLGPTNQLR
jgi:uncharacterized membrane protein